MEETKKQRQAEGASWLEKLWSEWHLKGYNFNGPYTEVESRFNLKYKGTVGTQNPHIPANILDYYAVIHDMMYFIPDKIAMAAADFIYVNNVLTNGNIERANKAIGAAVIGTGISWHTFEWLVDKLIIPISGYKKIKYEIGELVQRDLLNVAKQWKFIQKPMKGILNDLGIKSVMPPSGVEQKLGYLAPGAANTEAARARLRDKYGPFTMYAMFNLLGKVVRMPSTAPKYVRGIAKTLDMIYNSFPELRKVQDKYNEYLLSIGKFDEQGNFVIYDKIDKEVAKQRYIAFFDEWKTYIKFVNTKFDAKWETGEIDETDISKVYDIKKFDKEYELSLQLAEMNKIEEAFKSYTKISDLPNINSSITNNIFQDIPLAEMNITAEQRRGIEHLGHNLRYLPKEKQLEILNELVDDANKEYGLNITIKEADRNNPDKAYNKTFNKILQNVKRDQETLNKLIQLDEKYDNKIDEIVSNATLTTTTEPPETATTTTTEQPTTTTTPEPTTTTTTTQPPTTTTPPAEPPAEPQPTSSAEGIPPFMKISTVPEIKEKKTPEQRKEKNEPRPTETAPIKDTLVSGINPIQSLINKYMKYTKEDARRELLAMMAFVPSDANGGIGTEKTNELIKGNTATFNRTINGHLYDDWYDNTELTNTNNNSLQHKIKKKDVVQHFQYERLKTRAANIKNSRNSKKVLLNQIQTAYETNDFKPLVNPPGCYMYGSPYAELFEPLAANPNNGPHFDDYYKNENYFGNS